MTNSERVLEILRQLTETERDIVFKDIDEEFCLLCGGVQKCFCASSYDE